ncbi:MAG: hypothetical protein KAV87_56780, partial [Desulfobacteraceae bacterium]|nr:hypothetical protein [Desulfobacteraceae bacterium]
TGCWILDICNLLYEDLATTTIIPKLIDEIVMRMSKCYRKDIIISSLRPFLWNLSVDLEIDLVYMDIMHNIE